MTNFGAVSPGGGFSHLEASLSETLKRLTQQDVADLLAAGFSLQDLVCVVASTPPFNEILADRLHQHVRGSAN